MLTVTLTGIVWPAAMSDGEMVTLSSDEVRGRWPSIRELFVGAQPDPDGSPHGILISETTGVPDTVVLPCEAVFARVCEESVVEHAREKLSQTVPLVYCMR